jgi:hypothetical protein
MALQPDESELSSIGSAPDAQTVLARYLAVSTDTRPYYCSLRLEEGFSTWSSRFVVYSRLEPGRLPAKIRWNISFRGRSKDGFLNILPRHGYGFGDLSEGS